MTQLSEATRLTRQIIKFGSIALGTVFLVFLMYNIIVFAKDTFFPSPPVPPEEKFGKLPQIEFPQESLEINYKINER